MTRQRATAKDAIAQFRKETRRRWIAAFATGVLLTTSVLCAVFGFAVRAAGGREGLAWLLAGVVAIAATAFLTMVRGRRDLPHLIEQEGERAAEPLIERLDISYGAERAEVVRSLTALLDRLADSPDAVLSSLQPRRLNEMLHAPEFGRDEPLRVAVLRAVERIGDEESLRLVRALAIGNGDTWPEQRVRDTARAVLPGLTERVTRLRCGAHLLRPSDNRSAPAELLRGSQSATATDPDVLLRAPGEADAPADSELPANRS
jgi:hypothetical protein